MDATRLPGGGESVCTDETDNDGDSLVDCLDRADCGLTQYCLMWAQSITKPADLHLSLDEPVLASPWSGEAGQWRVDVGPLQIEVWTQEMDDQTMIAAVECAFSALASLEGDGASFRFDAAELGDFTIGSGDWTAVRTALVETLGYGRAVESYLTPGELEEALAALMAILIEESLGELSVPVPAIPLPVTWSDLLGLPPGSTFRVADLDVIETVESPAVWHANGTFAFLPPIAP